MRLAGGRAALKAGWLLGVLILTGCTTPASDPPDLGPGQHPFPPAAAVGDTRLFARIGEPGYPEGIAIDGGVVYVGTTARDGPAAAVFAFDLATGVLRRTVTVEGAGATPSFAVGLAIDAAGRVYAAEAGSGRVMRLDVREEPARQDVYAELPDLPACAGARPGPCSPTVQDAPPFVNHPAFGPDGTLYVSDSAQATIFRVPPGGGRAEVWFQDARFDVGFGLNGIAVSPDDGFLYLIDTGAAAPLGGLPSPGGAVWRVPLASPSPAGLELVHAFPGGLVDGLAFSASGRLYVTLIDGGLTGHGISVLGPDGAEEVFFPAPEANAALEVPYHEPANIAFHDLHRSILVTNQAFTAPERWAVLESFVDDTGAPLHRPALD